MDRLLRLCAVNSFVVANALWYWFGCPQNWFKVIQIHRSLFSVSVANSFIAAAIVLHGCFILGTLLCSGHVSIAEALAARPFESPQRLPSYVAPPKRYLVPVLSTLQVATGTVLPLLPWLYAPMFCRVT